MYDTLIDAKLACYNDTNCLGIYDYNGDNNYRLCPIWNSIDYSSKDSVYRKIEYSGNQIS